MIINFLEMIKKRHTITTLLAIFLFISIWTIQNNSYLISRDEMWYTDYSIHFNDHETEDVRYTTDLDLHQSAFPATFRILQRFSVGLMGKNIFGLRFLNLIFAIILLAVLSYFLQKRKLSANWIFLYILFLLFDSVVAKQSHILRPDWVFEISVVISICFLLLFLEQNRLRYLYITSIIAGFSVGIYWNGLASLAAFYFILTLFLFTRKIIFKEFLLIILLSLISLTIFFIIPTSLFFEETIALFQTDSIQANRLTSGNAFYEYFSSFTKLIAGLLKPTSYNLITGSFIAFFISAVIFSRFVKKNNKVLRDLLYIGSWGTIYILIVVLRGGDIRFVHLLLPLIYFLLIYLISSFDSGIRKHLFYKLMVMYLVIYTLMISANNILYIKNNSGQWREYQKFSKDLNELIPHASGRIFTVFDFTWALNDRPKYFMETILFNPVESEEEFMMLLETYDIDYMMVDERSRLRMFGEDEFGLGKEWYRYWDSILSNDFILVGEVVNKYYRHNKGIAPKNPNGYTTEIWKKKTSLK